MLSLKYVHCEKKSLQEKVTQFGSIESKSSIDKKTGFIMNK